jgi:hypothetical protein
MRVRARFTKLGKVRFTSHRDVARMWERALRKAGVPVAYTEGFSPRPKLHFGLALGTCYESLAEYLDIDIDIATDIATDIPTDIAAHPATDIARDSETDREAEVDGPAASSRPGAGLDLATLAHDVSVALPEGIDVTAMAPLEPRAASLQQAVTSCSWRIEVGCVPAALLAEAVEEALRAPQLVVTRERKGQQVTDDLRPFILSLQVEAAPAARPALLAELGTQPRTVRPAELVAALGGDLVEESVCRLQQWITHEGARHEPLVAVADAARAPTLVAGR